MKSTLRMFMAYEYDLNLEMTVRFFSSGLTGIATWWLKKDIPISAEQALRQIVRDLLPDYLRLMRKQIKQLVGHVQIDFHTRRFRPF